MTVMIGVDPHKATHTAVALDASEQFLGEGVDRRQQLEAVSPGIERVGVTLGAEDVAVQRHLHRRDQGSRCRRGHGCFHTGCNWGAAEESSLSP